MKPQTLLIYIVCGGLSYLIGAIPFGLIIAKLKGVNIRQVGSGNIGATNVLRAVGKTWGILTFICDAGKGFLPVRLLPQYFEATPALSIICAIMAVMGHNWPIYLRFKGGKGVATGAGALTALAPIAVGIALLVWLGCFLTTRYVSAASIAAAGTAAATAWFLPDKPAALLVTLLSFLIIWRHKTNIQRLLNGTENRFNFKK